MTSKDQRDQQTSLAIRPTSYGAVGSRNGSSNEKSGEILPLLHEEHAHDYPHPADVAGSAEYPEEYFSPESDHSLPQPKRHSSLPEYAPYEDGEANEKDGPPPLRKARQRRTSYPGLDQPTSNFRDDIIKNSNIFEEEAFIFPSFRDHWLPDKFEESDAGAASTLSFQFSSSTSSSAARASLGRRQNRPALRSLKRRIYLFLVEPTTSIGSAIFFFVLIFTITAMNVIMIMQTMSYWQFTPTDCTDCGGDVKYVFDDDDAISRPPNVKCVCPPEPYQWTVDALRKLIYFFTAEWILRVVCFEPSQNQIWGPSNSHDQEHSLWVNKKFWKLWFAHLTELGTIMDALAIFPFYLETLDNTNGLMSLRLLRLFRVFSLLRLGQYNTTFISLTNVLGQSLIYLKLLVVVMIFGAALFGSLMYWLERGNWQYHEASGTYRFMRIGVDGVTPEPTPFTSIPAAFWWFMVTASTVGYGDVYPTTAAGKWVASFAMLMGVLVVAFPVSVFSDLWHREVRRIDREMRKMNLAAFTATDDDEGDSYDDDEGFSGDQASAPGFRGNAPQQSDDFDLYDTSRAKEFDTLMSMSMSRLRLSSTRDADALSSMNSSAIAKDTPSANESEPIDTDASTTRARGKMGTVTMERDDLNEILKRLEAIRENEERIREVLKKYTGSN